MLFGFEFVLLAWLFIFQSIVCWMLGGYTCYLNNFGYWLFIVCYDAVLLLSLCFKLCCLLFMLEFGLATIFDWVMWVLFYCLLFCMVVVVFISWFLISVLFECVLIALYGLYDFAWIACLVILFYCSLFVYCWLFWVLFVLSFAGGFIDLLLYLLCCFVWLLICCLCLLDLLCLYCWWLLPSTWLYLVVLLFVVCLRLYTFTLLWVMLVNSVVELYRYFVLVWLSFIICDFSLRVSCLFCIYCLVSDLGLVLGVVMCDLCWFVCLVFCWLLL